MAFLEEFKKFAVRGNMIDMAVGIIIGAAFGRVVNSLVTDVLMPPIGMLIGGIDFSLLAIPLKDSVGDEPPVLIRYGAFINAVIDFLIVAFSIFLVVKTINQLQKEEPIPQSNTKDCPQCCLSIPANAKKCGHCCTQIM